MSSVILINKIFNATSKQALEYLVLGKERDIFGSDTTNYVPL